MSQPESESEPQSTMTDAARAAWLSSYMNNPTRIAATTLNLVDCALAQQNATGTIKLSLPLGTDSPSPVEVDRLTAVFFPASVTPFDATLRATELRIFAKNYAKVYVSTDTTPYDLLLPGGAIPTFVDNDGRRRPLFSNITDDPPCVLRLRCEFHASGIPRSPATWCYPRGTIVEANHCTAPTAPEVSHQD